MPKSQYIRPEDIRKPGYIAFDPIPVMQYAQSIEEEQRRLGTSALIGVFRDMTLLREFETMLNAIKREGGYRGIAYNHPGPAHLSIGQEAAAVGQALHLQPEDIILGSHRSHGEILAKGLSVVAKLDAASLQTIMEQTQDGRILRIIERAFPQAGVKDRAVAFLLYGALAEIFARETGFNHGLGGSMHAFFLPFGIYPNNAIVGGSADIATGVALYKRVNNQPGAVVANIGDASLGCGPVWEALNFAAMDQLWELWPEERQGGLPILFNVFNNQYGMGGQTQGETMAYDMLARIGAGVSPTQLHAERVDGYNPLAVADAMERKLPLLREGHGPALLDVVTYRFSGHSPSDASTYRVSEEIEAWQAIDPMTVYPSALAEAGVCSRDTLDGFVEKAGDMMAAILNLVIDDSVSPKMDLVGQPNRIADLMFSNKTLPKTREGQPDTLIPKEENPRVVQLQKRERFGLDKDGKPFSSAKTFALRDGIFEAVLDRFYQDPSLIAYGEDNRDWGGAFAVYRGLTESLPYHRFFNSPISEAAIVGTAVGYAMAGGRAIVELMYCDFMGRAGDEIFNQLAKWQAMSAGELKMPVVLRVSVGSKYGAQHSQEWSAMVGHVPGLKAVFPATPYDAKGLMAAALEGTDPVVFFESQRIYDIGEWFHEGGIPAEHYTLPIGQPDIKRPGKDITILTVGAALYRALKAAKTLEAEYGLSAEIIDARSLVPFDYTLLLESVQKTGRLVLVGDACERGSFLSDMARNVTEMAFDYLDAPPVVVGARNWITPASEYEEFFFPQESWILDAIHQRILPLPGYVPQQAYTNAAQISKAQKGV